MRKTQSNVRYGGKLRSADAQPAGPLCPKDRTSSARLVRSEKCQHRTLPRRGIRVRPPRNENGGNAFQHRLALLMAQQVSVADYSPVRFRFRGAQLQNRHFEIERVTRAYRVRLLQLIPTQSHQDLEVRLKLTREQDVDRKRMRPRCRQSAKYRLCREFLVEYVQIQGPIQFVLGDSELGRPRAFPLGVYSADRRPVSSTG